MSREIAVTTYPNASHTDTIKYRPQVTPDTKARTADDRETDVVHGSYTTRRANKRSRDEIADPNANP